jgi:RimJ/RimL family protein N-acetyltransferase
VGRLPAELHTERLRLRQWRAEDVEPLAEIYAQPEFLEHMPAVDLDETRAQVETFASQWDAGGFSHWAAEDRATGRLIGLIGLLRYHDWPLWSMPVEVGWTLDRDWCGRGLATEGGRAAVECWREHLDDRLLISITLPANRRSQAVMRRLGMTPRGRVHWRGYDQIWHALDRGGPS